MFIQAYTKYSVSLKYDINVFMSMPNIVYGVDSAQLY